jgi:hypothetical protein
MPVIRQENPRREEKVVLLSPLPHHAGQAREFGFLKPASVREQPTGHEKESVEQDQAAQAGHDTALYALWPRKNRRVSKNETLRHPLLSLRDIADPRRRGLRQRTGERVTRLDIVAALVPEAQDTKSVSWQPALFLDTCQIHHVRI